MASKDISAGNGVVPDVDPKTNTASNSTCHVPKTVEVNKYDFLPLKRENEAKTLLSPINTEDAKHKAKMCLLKQDAIYSRDDPDYVDMKPRKGSEAKHSRDDNYVDMKLQKEPDGHLARNITAPFNVSVNEYATIDEETLDRSYLESNSTNTSTETSVPSPKPESTLRLPLRQTLPPPLPTSDRPPCISRNIDASSPKVPRSVWFHDDTEPPKEFSYPQPSESCRKVLIRDIPAELSTEEIAVSVETEIAMKNVIEDLSVNRTYKEVVVTFRNSKVAKEILERALSGEKFFMTDSEVIVLPYQEPPLDQMKALVSGLARGTTAEDISRCIEKRCGNRPSNVILGENPGIALVCLQNSDDLQRQADCYFCDSLMGRHGLYLT